jgi:hypothetical protein
MQRFDIETHKGAIYLDALRKKMGDERFLKLMSDFFAAHTTHAVTAREFLKAAGVSFTLPPDPGGALYIPRDIGPRLGSAVLVYGTVSEAGANRYAAEQLQKRYLDAFESAVPIRKDFEVTEAELKTRDVIFVGRPETNAALARWQRQLSLDYDGALFRIADNEYAAETEALALAAANPLDRKRMVLILAGNSALETVRLASSTAARAEFSVFDSGKQSASGFRKQ